jgi:hypothetical protein
MTNPSPRPSPSPSPIPSPAFSGFGLGIGLGLGLGLGILVYGQETPTHDISKVDPARKGTIAVPVPELSRRLRKQYDMPELVGARPAIGSQLINGELPRPLLDYVVRSANIEQRISFFEGDLVVIRLTGAGGTMQKKVFLPEDAVKKYLETASATAVLSVREGDVSPPADGRRALLRRYDPELGIVEREFDPAGARPRRLHNQIHPLEDLLRVLSEDRAVTSSVTGYEPKVGDELVGDDSRTYRVVRIIKDSQVVELRCTTQPTILYVAKKDLYNYFVGRAGE